VSEHDTFLQAILADPDDDAPRLMYADWLERRRDPRGEFIRVQCTLAKLVRDDPKRTDLVARERVLLNKHETEWVGPLRQWAKRWEFRRGFVEAVLLPAEAFLAHADALFQIAPIRRVSFVSPFLQSPPVRHATLPIGGPVIARLAACPYLARLSAVNFNCHIGPTGMATLAATPLPLNLTWLNLSGGSIGDEGVRSLAASPHFAGLTFLDLSSNHIGPEGARALVHSPHITQLASLTFAYNGLGDGGVQALAASANTSMLTTLRLVCCRVSTAGARALSDSPYLGRLHSLELVGNHIGKGAREALRRRFGRGNCRF
jgi:uncharacterized protein (TIGR02996 family)